MIDDVTARFLGQLDGGSSCFWSRAGRAYRASLVGEVSGGELCWAILGRDVQFCSNSLTENAWTALADFDPGWLIEHGYWVQLTSGKDTAPLVADVLRRHRLFEAVQSALSSLREREAASERWTVAVVAGCRPSHTSAS